jgi:hypothetical protein
MFLLIFNEKRVLKFTFVSVLTYYVNHSLEGAPHLLIAIGWSIVNIQSDLRTRFSLKMSKNMNKRATKRSGKFYT